MAYGRFGGAPKFWHHGVDGWLSLEDGRQSSPVVRRQEINGGGGVWVIWKREMEVQDAKSSPVSRPSRLQKRQDQAR